MEELINNNTIAFILTIASLIVGIASLVVAIKVWKDQDKLERSLVTKAHELIDLSHHHLLALSNELGDKNLLTHDYRGRNHSIVLSLASISERFAQSWIDLRPTEEEKEQWRIKFGMKK